MNIKPVPAQMIIQMEYEEGFQDGYRQAMREMPEIVRCKDCKFWYKDECSHLCKITGDLHPANWYCADGERRAK